MQPAGISTKLTTSSDPTGLSAGDRIYGWFRAYFDDDPNETLFSVLGILNVRESDFTFTSLESFNRTVILEADFSFLPAGNYSYDGTTLTAATATDTFEIERLSSVLVRPELRTPVPATGTQITTFFVASGGQEFDLLPYFDYNKDYLSYPLTDRVDTLFLSSSSVDRYYDIDGSGDPTGSPVLRASTLASLTWEEQ